MSKYLKGDIWYCVKIGNNNNGVLSGARPVLIISNNKFNEESPVLQVVAISHKQKYSPVHIQIQLNKKSYINCEQIQTINKKYLKQFMITLSEEEMAKVEDRLKFQLDI